MPEILFRDFGDENGDLVIMCGYRLFINGVDVSDHVLGSISWSYAGRGGENACSFQLDNNNDKFVLKPSNLGLSEDMSDTNRSFADTESFSTQEPWAINVFKAGGTPTYVTSAIAETLGLSTFSETSKKKLYLDKLKKRAQFDDTATNHNLKSYTKTDSGALAATPTISNDISLYEGLFFTKSPVINIMDQVRLYIVDPNRDPVDAADSLWINVFTGFVMSAPPEHDFSNGQSTISVTCSDIRTLLKRKRVLVNSVSADQITPSIGLGTGLFSDIVQANNNTTNAFADQSLTFERLIALALTGLRISDNVAAMPNLSSYCVKYGEDASNKAWAAAKKQYQTALPNAEGKPVAVNKDGFGALWFGFYYMYDKSYFVENESPEKQRGVHEAREKFMNSWNRITVFGQHQDYLTWNDMLKQGSTTKPDGENSALNALVHFLVPSGGNQVSNLLDRTFIDQMGVQREYMSIGEIIDQVCERIDYQYTVSGTGDLIFEFPMYDFHAKDMGPEFKAVCSISDSVKNHAINDEANSNPITALKVTGGYTDKQNSVDVPDPAKAQLYTIHIFHYLLAPRYGLSEEEYQVPFLANGADTRLSDEKYHQLITLFGVLEFLKRLTEMSSLTTSSVFNPFLRPNRPYYYNYGRRLALTETVSNTLALFTNGDTQVDSKYVRRIHDITGEVVAFGGSVGMPLNYSNVESINSFLSDNLNTYQSFVTKLFNSGIDILIPSGSATSTSAVSTQFTSLNDEIPSMQLCKWGPGAYQAFLKICHDQGASPEDLAAIINWESNGFNTNAVNPNTKALGLNQMMPSTVIEMLEMSQPGDRGSFKNKYPGCEELLKFKRKADGKGKLPEGTPYVANGDKGKFEETYKAVFNTPEKQLDVYNEYLNLVRKQAQVGPEYKFDSIKKLSAAQLTPSKLRELDKNGDITLSQRDQDANNGTIKTIGDYANKVASRTPPKKARQYVQTMERNNCESGTGSNPAPEQPNTLGGTGTMLQPLANAPSLVKSQPPTAPPTKIIPAEGKF